MSRTRAVLTATVVLSALALGGCTDDDPEPKFEPSESTSPTSPSSTSTTAAAALSPEDTVRAWVDAQNEALTTGDVERMEALAAPDCQGCTDFSDPIEQVIANGGKYSGGEWTVDAAKAKPAAGTEIVVDVAMSMAEGTTVPRRGAKPISFGSDKRIMKFQVSTAPDGMLTLSYVGFVE